jgi:DNA-binding protein HU-beta
MNRLELARKIADEHGLSHAAAARILGTVTSTIMAAVKKGNPVGIVGFGTFRLVSRAARKGYNPKAGVAIKVPARKVPKFVPGTGFKDLVDARVAARRAEAAKKTARKAARRRA